VWMHPGDRVTLHAEAPRRGPVSTREHGRANTSSRVSGEGLPVTRLTPLCIRRKIVLSGNRAGVPDNRSRQTPREAKGVYQRRGSCPGRILVTDEVVAPPGYISYEYPGGVPVPVVVCEIEIQTKKGTGAVSLSMVQVITGRVRAGV